MPRGLIGQMTTGGVIVDQICACGHSINDHGALGGLKYHWVRGKGACEKCHCLQFKCTGFVYEDPPAAGQSVAGA